MFQFSGFAPYRVICLQHIGLPHSEITGYNLYVPVPGAYRSLSRPSSPLRATGIPHTPLFCLLYFTICGLLFVVCSFATINPKQANYKHFVLSIFFLFFLSQYVNELCVLRALRTRL